MIINLTVDQLKHIYVACGTHESDYSFPDDSEAKRRRMSEVKSILESALLEASVPVSPWGSFVIDYSDTNNQNQTPC